MHSERLKWGRAWLPAIGQIRWIISEIRMTSSHYRNWDRWSVSLLASDSGALFGCLGLWQLFKLQGFVLADYSIDISLLSPFTARCLKVFPTSCSPSPITKLWDISCIIPLRLSFQLHITFAIPLAYPRSYHGRIPGCLQWHHRNWWWLASWWPEHFLQCMLCTLIGVNWRAW